MILIFFVFISEESHFLHFFCLQYSGYGQEFRTEVIRSALHANNRWPGDWRQLERAQERRRIRETWYAKGGFNTVIFVPATPGSQLKDRYMKDIKETGFKIKVIEQSGVTLKRMLQRSDPFREKQCRSIDCLVCRTGGK